MRRGRPEGCFRAVAAGGWYSLGALTETALREGQHGFKQGTCSLASQLTLCYEVLLVRVDPVDRLEAGPPVAQPAGELEVLGVAIDAIGQALLLQEHAAKHAALLADALCQGAGVDAVHGRDALLLEPCAEGRVGEEV